MKWIIVLVGLSLVVYRRLHVCLSSKLWPDFKSTDIWRLEVSFSNPYTLLKKCCIQYKCHLCWFTSRYQDKQVHTGLPVQLEMPSDEDVFLSCTFFIFPNIVPNLPWRKTGSHFRNESYSFCNTDQSYGPRILKINKNSKASFSNTVRLVIALIFLAIVFSTNFKYLNR